MKKLYMQFRIGEKIGFSCALVVLLFLGVVWQYHQTLQQSLSEYQRLQTVFAAKKGHALAIERRMLEARRAERDFLLHRNEEFAADVQASLDRVLVQAEELSRVDDQGAETGTRITTLAQTYRQRFNAIAQGWRAKGLDHNTGLQGAFRDTVHRLQARAEHYKVGGLMLQLLKIRREEKDLALTQDRSYRDTVIGQIGVFEARVNASGVDGDLKQLLLRESERYREAFLDFTDRVLDGGATDAGDGSVDQAAERIQALLDHHYIPDMGYNLLQLRRREKDYLLRGDRQYVDMALQELVRIQEQIERCDIPETDQLEMQILLDDYRRDFLALVEQNQEIDQLHREMRAAVAEVTQLVRENVRDAQRAMQQRTRHIEDSTADNARFMLWIAALAAVLGVLFAVVISVSITRPLRRIAGVLDQVAYEEPIDHIPTLPGGRDEINAMAESVNTMAEHKALFLDWWKTSMRENKALEQTARHPDSVPADGELEESRIEKQALVSTLHEKLRTLLRTISEHAHKLEQTSHGQHQGHAQGIRQAARSARAILDVIRRR